MTPAALICPASGIASRPTRVRPGLTFLICALLVPLPEAWATDQGPTTTGLRVGAASAEFEADDSMIIAGGITPGKATGQEGKLRAVADVLQKEPYGKLASVACDILTMTREWLDPATATIPQTTGIPAANTLIN